VDIATKNSVLSALPDFTEQDPVQDKIHALRSRFVLLVRSKAIHQENPNLAIVPQMVINVATS
jgi:hypothetical protein